MKGYDRNSIGDSSDASADLHRGSRPDKGYKKILAVLKPTDKARKLNLTRGHRLAGDSFYLNNTLHKI